MLGLTDKLRIETEEIAGRLYTRAFVGHRELTLSQALLHSLLQLHMGRAIDEAAIRELLSAGVLHNIPSEQELPPQVALSPYAVLEIEPQPQRHRGHSVSPQSSLPISLFVPPAILDPLQRLAAQLRQAYRHMLSAALSRQQPLPIPQALHVLTALCQEAFAQSPDLSHALTLTTTPFAITANRPLQTETVQYPLRTLRMFPDRQSESAGKEPRILPLRSDTGPATEHDHAALRSLAELLERLQHGCSTQSVRELIPQLGPTARMLWHQLVAQGLLIPAPNDSDLTEQIPAGTVMHLGHATLLANLGGQFVLVDPWLPPASVSDDERPLFPQELPPLAAIFITHHHWDHVHVPTLLRLPKQVPIYVPEQDRNQVLLPRTDLLLLHLGFTQVRTLRPGQSVPFGEGGEVVAVPFYGEDPTLIGYAGCCYLLKHQGKAALVHVDSGPNLSGQSTVRSGIGAALLEQHGALSPVFATRRQERGIMIEHTWEYLLAPPEKWLLPTENCCTGAQFLADLCASTGSTCLALYSEGGADFYPEGTDFLRRKTPTARALPHQFLWDELSDITRAVSQAGAHLHMSTPYHCFQIGGGFVGRRPPGGPAPIAID